MDWKHLSKTIGTFKVTDKETADMIRELEPYHEIWNSVGPGQPKYLTRIWLHKGVMYRDAVYWGKIGSYQWDLEGYPSEEVLPESIMGYCPESEMKDNELYRKEIDEYNAKLARERKERESKKQ